MVMMMNEMVDSDTYITDKIIYLQNFLKLYIADTQKVACVNISILFYSKIIAFNANAYFERLLGGTDV